MSRKGIFSSTTSTICIICALIIYPVISPATQSLSHSQEMKNAQSSLLNIALLRAFLHFNQRVRIHMLYITRKRIASCTSSTIWICCAPIIQPVISPASQSLSHPQEMKNAQTSLLNIALVFDFAGFPTLLSACAHTHLIYHQKAQCLLYILHYLNMLRPHNL